MSRKIVQHNVFCHFNPVLRADSLSASSGLCTVDTLTSPCQWAHLHPPLLWLRDRTSDIPGPPCGKTYTFSGLDNAPRAMNTGHISRSPLCFLHRERNACRMCSLHRPNNRHHPHISRGNYGSLLHTDSHLSAHALPGKPTLFRNEFRLCNTLEPFCLAAYLCCHPPISETQLIAASSGRALLSQAVQIDRSQTR